MGIFNLFSRKKKIVVNFNSEDFTENEKLVALLNENAYLKGLMARIKADESKKRESEKDKDEETEKIKMLLQQEADLKKKEINPFSLFSVFKYMTNKKHKNKPIKFTSFDGGKILGYVNDFVVMPDGGFGVVSGGKVIWASKDINHVFYSLNGLNNLAKERIIPLCINDKWQFTPNLMNEEVSDVVRTSDGKFKINRINRKPFYEHLAENEEEISELNGEVENLEATTVEQQKEIYEKSREASLHKVRADKIQSELSIALDKVAEIEMASGQIIRQNMALVNLKEINEGLIDSMEKIVERWTGKIEEKFGKDLREGEWEELKSKLDWAKANMPQTIYQMPEKEEKPSLIEGVRPQKV